MSAATQAGECGSDDKNRIHAWSEAASRAIPERVVPPTYPPAELLKGVTGKVDATLRIGRNGRVDEVLSIKADSGDGAFEKAVVDVIRHWLFLPETGCDCKPVEANVLLTVWFEIKEGQPSISVSRAALNDAEESKKPPLMITGAKSAMATFSATYPRAARRASEEGTVYGIIRIDATTGIAQGMDVTHVEANPDFRRTFSAATGAVVPGMQFGFEGTPTESPVRTCFVIHYRLRK